MIRFLMSLFGKDYNPCRSCELLSEQLEYERAQNKEMLETLTSLLKPVPIINQIQESRPLSPRGITFTKRRAELEKQDREKARIEKTSPYIAKPDNEVKKDEPKTTTKTVEQLEMELGVVDSESDGAAEQQEVH